MERLLAGRRGLDHAVGDQRQVAINPAFVAEIDQDLIDKLTTLAGNTSLPAAAQYLATNAIWVLGGFCKNVAAWKTAAVQAITDIRALWSPGLTPPALWTPMTQFTQQRLWTGDGPGRLQ